ncbi:MAG: HAMP domain-containing histidine kinase [Acidobacteriia bacterium]|nr:HAMP domain-containing histidine kinase [Terriglobia bacterium]
MSAALLLLYAVLSLLVPHGHALAAWGDITQLLLLLAASIVMTANAVSERGQTRLFWSLMAVGCFMWSVSQGGWTYYEVLLHRDLPDPYFGDIILFVHVVPFMAALALRPHLAQEEQKLYFTTLNFLMLLIWWVFLYAFIVFPDEYVAMNVPLYSRNYDVLYLVENLVLLGALGLLTAGTRGAWRTIYRHLTVAMALYTFCSEAMNAAIARGQYYTGSIYDIPFVAGVCWLIWVGLLARELKPRCEPPPPELSRWMALAPRLAMIAILSLPVMGYWAVFYLDAPLQLRHFRLLVTLAAMLVLGVCVFIRQYLLDHELMRLLDTSHRSLENLQRLQSQLVQKEKLASLGQLVAGAAHEINNPLAAILGYSELLSSNEALAPNQVSMAQKIGQQARRTRDLVSDLLSFAQQAPAEKALLDVGSLLHRAIKMETLRLEGKQVRVETKIAPDLPRIWGNGNQLFQCCLQIIGNAVDALEEVGGGALAVEGRREGDEVVLEFSDSGPGIREPQRVFDPFYTTKPIGKGTGLGLSATYGVVQDHHGHIACHNRSQGGAVFVLRFPVPTTAMLPEARAAKA